MSKAPEPKDINPDDTAIFTGYAPGFEHVQLGVGMIGKVRKTFSEQTHFMLNFPGIRDFVLLRADEIELFERASA